MHARRLLREPILQFLLIGAALFLGYGLVAPDRGSDERIVVTTAVVDDLARQYLVRWNRAPDDETLARLIESHVRDEVLYREGVALGLDRDDPVIKRRVRQKLDLIAEEALAADAPTEAQLGEFLAANADRFRRPPRLSFEQVPLDGSLAGSQLDTEVASIREALARGTDPDTLGATSLLPRRFDGLPLDLVARDFGSGFAERLQALRAGEWGGPMRSGFGAHLVRVTAIVPSELPPLEAVRTEVAREWEVQRRTRSADDSYRRMRARYTVTIEAKGSAAGTDRP